MNSSLAARHGLPPTLAIGPNGDGLGLNPGEEQDVLDVLRWAGLILDDWQESLLFASLQRDSCRFWAAFEVAAVVPRQNGKGAIMEARQLAGLFVLGERLQIHTAHEFKTAYEHFLRVKSLVEGSDELFQQVRIIRTGAGDQSIELHPPGGGGQGPRLRFLARSRSSVRGFSADVVYFDEAFELPLSTVGSVLPSLSARPNPQVWYLSSAPHRTSEFLHSLLRRAQAGDEERLLLRAWENESETPVDDVEAWRRANPALGIRIDEEFVRNEMRTLCATADGTVEFQRERLGIRDRLDGEGGIVPFDLWLDLADAESTVTSSLSYGLSVSASGRSAAVGSAGRRADGKLHVDKVEHRDGTDWVVDFVAELCLRKRKPIRVNPQGAEGAFVRQLVEAGVEVIEVSATDYQQACGEFLDAVKNGALRHLGQEKLNRAVSVADRRELGREGAWVWASQLDVSTLKAASLALTGVTKRKRAVDNVW